LTAGTRRKSRELAMQMLFQADIGKQTPTRCAPLSGKPATKSSPKSAALPRTSSAWPLPPGTDRRTDRGQLQALAAGAHARRRSQPAAHGRGRDAGLQGHALSHRHQRSAGDRPPLLRPPESINFLNGMLGRHCPQPKQARHSGRGHEHGFAGGKLAELR
jgi:hypothetical protein